jgi:protein TonB
MSVEHYNKNEQGNIFMYLLNNGASPMMAKKHLLFEELMGEESPQAMGGLLLILVVLLHIGVFYFIQSLAPAEPAKPKIIMEVTMVAVPLPVADVAPPLPTVAPPPPIVPPAPVPPPPKPIVKPKPVVKPKPKLKPKPVVPKTEPIYIPVAEKPSPLPVTTPTPAPAPVKAAPAPAKAAPGPSKPQRFTQASVGANYGYNPKPKYPSIARSRGWEGKVILNVHVSASGESEGVSVIQSSGHEVLDDAAVAAVEGWRFVPAKRGDTAVASTVHVPINFRLDN